MDGKTKTKWSDQAITTLIETYQQYECLWNLTCQEYKDRNKMSLVLKKVDEVMQQHGINRTDYQKKWGVLRGQN